MLRTHHLALLQCFRRNLYLLYIRKYNFPRYLNNRRFGDRGRVHLCAPRDSDLPHNCLFADGVAAHGMINPCSVILVLTDQLLTP